MKDITTITKNQNPAKENQMKYAKKKKKDTRDQIQDQDHLKESMFH